MTKRGWLFFSIMTVLWGIPYLLIRIAVRDIDPGVLVLGRTAPAALLLLPVVFYKKDFPALVKNFFWIAIFGVVEFGAPWYLMATAEKHITSSLTSLLICCVPLFSVVAQWIRRTEDRISPQRYLGLGIGAIGVMFLVGLDLRGGTITWIAVMLIICVGYTIGPIILAQKLGHVPGYTVVAGATGFVALCWIPWDVAHWPAHISTETWECLGVLSVFCTASAFLALYELIKEVGSTRALVVTYFNTAVAVVLGVLILNEPLTAGIIVGFPLVLLGSIFATSKAKGETALTNS